MEAVENFTPISVSHLLTPLGNPVMSLLFLSLFLTRPLTIRTEPQLPVRSLTPLPRPPPCSFVLLTTYVRFFPPQFDTRTEFALSRSVFTHRMSCFVKRRIYRKIRPFAEWRYTFSCPRTLKSSANRHGTRSNILLTSCRIDFTINTLRNIYFWRSYTFVKKHGVEKACGILRALHLAELY